MLFKFPHFLHTCSLALKAVALFILAGLASPAASAKEPLVFGISFSIPPWVMRENDSGLKLDLIRAALDHTEYRFVPKYVSHARSHEMFSTGAVGAVLSGQKAVLENGFLSEPVVNFQNYAISLKKKGFPADISVDFLKDKSVIAFQKASRLLGPRFTAAVEKNARYEEFSRQSLQLNRLFIREIDFIVTDRSVFGFYWRQAAEVERVGDKRFLQPVVFHQMFKPTEYSFLFADSDARDAFNLVLSRIKEDGTYSALVERYMDFFNLYQPAIDTL